HRIGVDDNAGVYCRNDPVDANLACIVHLDFGNRGNVAVKCELQADPSPGPPAVSGLYRLSPACLARSEIHGRLHSRRLVEHGTTKGHRVLPRFLRKLVNKALNGKPIIVRPDTTPEPCRNAGWLSTYVLNEHIRDVVRDLSGAIDRVDINPLLERRWQPAS